MARRKTKVKDKWREKRWVSVVAPDSFNNVPIAYVPITDDETAKGRVVEVTLFDILRRSFPTSIQDVFSNRQSRGR